MNQNNYFKIILDELEPCMDQYHACFHSGWDITPQRKIRDKLVWIM